MSNVSIPTGWPVDSDWSQLLTHVFESAEFQSLQSFVYEQRQQNLVYPKTDEVFNAFSWTDLSDVKVVILGQDPYHGNGQAHGLSFSVPKGIKPPPSLRNIFKELQSDLNCDMPTSGSLKSWARQGVLLLNTVLTVREGEANSHRRRGWENFTDEVIRQLSLRSTPVVFLLWGKPAQTKSSLIDNRHVILAAPHPSPLSAYRGFFGSCPFSKANAALEGLGQQPIDWCSVCN